MRKMPAPCIRLLSLSALLSASLFMASGCDDSSARQAPAVSTPVILPPAETPTLRQNTTTDPLNRIRYHCTNDLVVTVEYGGDSATLTLANESHVLMQEPSGSGARYSNKDVSWHAREQEAMLSAGDDARICLQLAR
ncbi:MliC family protein [Alcanivorax sp. JB21]|uniref:MliC family protein n=1 Tax=Alcanivorax limicola TaxID=2874102 RepID=UPI001CBD5CD5|nr:MliC family protein [Alcanivorax limicola]MBZ2188566.1 MliC family protein [Alcanivorax limicola]